jgi:hypothetical protein
MKELAMTVTHLKDRMTGRLRLFLGLSIVLLYGCNTGVAPPPVTKQQQAVQPPSVAQPAVPPAVSINELMVAWIDHAGHELWDVEQEGRAPQNDADWREVARHATQLAASGTLIALGGTGQADLVWAQSSEWKRYSQELTDAGVAALNAAHRKNFELLLKANGLLVGVCEGCHKEFKPALPTEGKKHQPH